jgi:hypothetical protein
VTAELPRFVLLFQIDDGTNQIQRIVIAKAILKD